MARKQRPRNLEMAVILKNDPNRVRTRVVETEDRKLQHNRARSKEEWLNELDEELDNEVTGSSK